MNAPSVITPPKPQKLPARAIYVDDNLPILRGFNSDMVDLIYLDPPFNTGRGFVLPGGEKRKMAFTDTWKWSEEHNLHRYALGLDSPDAVAVVDTARMINGNPHGAYLVYMGVRLLEMRRILKPTGSIYFHCDPVMSHSVKMLMDAIFGRENFMNEIIWYYGGGGASTKRWGRKHDVIFFYRKSDECVFNADAVRRPHKLDYEKGALADDVFIHHGVIPWSKERTGYPTQKPLVLLQRLILASSSEGDLVLDPFCGCATTCIAAEMQKRRWIGIDLSKEARRLVKTRLYDTGVDRVAAHKKVPVSYPDKRPKRTDMPGEHIDRKEWLKRLYTKQQGICNGCYQETRADLMDIDHIIPKSRGGSNIPVNLQLLCRSCNTIKGAGTMEELFKKLAKLESAEKINQWRASINKKIADNRRPKD